MPDFLSSRASEGWWRPSQEWRRASGWPPTTWIHQICRDTGVTATEALQLAEDRPFWRTIATAGGFGWSLRVTTTTTTTRASVLFDRLTTQLALSHYAMVKQLRRLSCRSDVHEHRLLPILLPNALSTTAPCHSDTVRVLYGSKCFWHVFKMKRNYDVI